MVAAELGKDFTNRTGIIPQNVNFAIKSENIQKLLAGQSIKLNRPAYHYKTAIDAIDIIEIAKKGIVRIEVLKE